MQISGVLRPKRRVLGLNTTLNEAYKGFEMEVSGPLTVFVEEGSLRDEIERAGGIAFVAQLTSSGTIQMKYIPYADALTPDEAEEIEAERDTREFEQRKEERARRREEREKLHEANFKNVARLSLTEKKRLETVEADEKKALNASHSAPGAPASVSDDDLNAEVDRLKSEIPSGPITDRISTILADVDSTGKPIPNEKQAEPFEEPENQETYKTEPETGL